MGHGTPCLQNIVEIPISNDPCIAEKIYIGRRWGSVYIEFIIIVTK